jgi:hypothetical protein
MMLWVLDGIQKKNLEKEGSHDLQSYRGDRYK